MPYFYRSALGFAALAATSLCHAQAPAAADKSGDSLFRPTPAAHLRELSTDRPDITESPYSVDAGHWQIESDLIAHTRDHDNSGGADTVVDETALAHVNIKIGLTSRIDLQTVIETHTRVKARDRLTGATDKLSGLGDITSRLKINLWGNDGGDTAAALMPFIKWPTNRHGLGNDSIEGGLIVPIAFALPGDWSLGVMTEIDIVRNQDDDGYAADWVNTITAGHNIAGDLDGYVELTSTLTRGRDLATFDCGLTYGLSKNVQLDAGANIGLTRASADLTLFAGISLRY